MRSPDVSLARPVRMLHPRFPLYIVPAATAFHDRRDRGRGEAAGRSTCDRPSSSCPRPTRWTRRSARPRSLSLAPACGRPFPTTGLRCGAGRVAARQRPVTGTAFCWRRHSRAGWRMPCSIYFDSETIRCGFSSTVTRMTRGRNPGRGPRCAGFGCRKIATAVNGRFVAATARKRTHAHRRRQGRGRGADAGRLGRRSTARPSLAAAARDGALSSPACSSGDQGVGRRGRHGFAAPRVRRRPRRSDLLVLDPVARRACCRIPRDAIRSRRR